MEPLLISVLLLPKPTMTPREAPEGPPWTLIVPLLMMVLASSTVNARSALVTKVAPGATVIVTFWLPAAAATNPLVVVPVQVTLWPEPGDVVGAQAAAARVGSRAGLRTSAHNAGCASRGKQEEHCGWNWRDETINLCSRVPLQGFNWIISVEYWRMQDAAAID
jgi:hypothetical protein